MRAISFGILIFLKDNTAFIDLLLVFFTIFI